MGRNRNTIYTEKDAAEETGVSITEVNAAWHQARDDAAEDGDQGVPQNRHGEQSEPSSEPKDDES